MVDRGSEPKKDLDERDEKLAEYITRLEEENRQLSERVEKAEEQAKKLARKMLWWCELPNAILITLLLALIVLIILQVAH